MREIRALLVYVAGAAGLLAAIMIAGSWAVSAYQQPVPMEAGSQTTGVAGNSDVAVKREAEDPSRQPVWIEPTRKYSYSTSHVPVVKVEPAAPPVAPSVSERRIHGRTASKPSRTVETAHRPSRRMYRTAEQTPPMQMQILPLQHQAPN